MDHAFHRCAIPFALLALPAALALAGCTQDSRPAPDALYASGQTRTYYVAAERVAWDYAPSGIDRITGQPFDAGASVYMQRGPHRIGRVHDKALYREYTDDTFTVPKPPPAGDEHLAVLGPVVRAVVGDTVRFVFKNATEHTVSVHTHGVLFDKRSEGAPYDDGTGPDEKGDDAVPPGQVHTYTWYVPERSGPGPMDGSSVLWMYHSHVDEPADTNAGLIGPLVVTAREHARPDARPDDVDRELFSLFTIFDENTSFYLHDNVAKYCESPGDVDLDDADFKESNKMHSINGRSFGNLEGLTMHVGERVRWYVFAQGSESDIHTPHWHGNTVTMMGMRTDVIQLLPMGMMVADMVPDNPGTWLYHCHVNDHLVAGMMALYDVTP
jgi:hephaestin